MNSRRFSVVLMIFAAGMLGVTLYMQHQQNKNAPATQPAATQPAAAPTTAPAGAGPSASTSAPVGADGEWLSTNVDNTILVPLGSLDKSTGYRFQVQLTNNGAAIYTAKLADYFVTVADKKLAAEHEKDFAKYLEISAKDPAKYKGNYSLLNPLAKGMTPTAKLDWAYDNHQNPLFTRELYLPYSSRSVTIRRPGKPVLTLDLEQVRWKAVATPATSPDSDSLRFEWKLAMQQGSKTVEYLKLVKTYTIRKGSYAIEIALDAQNLSAEPMTISLNQYGSVGVPREDVRTDLRKFAYGRLEDGKVVVKLDDIHNKDLDANPALPYEQGKPVLWSGQSNKFFASLMFLEPTEGNLLSGQRPATSFYASKAADGENSQTFVSGVELNGLSLSPGQSARASFDVFTGPKFRDQFENVEPYKSLNYMTVIETSGGCFCSFSWLALAIMWLLEFLAKYLTLGNYGVAIVILVILVRFALHPLTKKGQISMMKMQKLGPKMAELKEKYKDDKDTLQRETMKFYKEQGASPLIGCLPMLLQMPIWIALYNGLSVDVSLRQAPFLPVWITNLAGQDAIFSWASTPIHVPFLDSLIGPIVSFNLLPLLLSVAMYYQTKLTPTTAATTPQQAQQQAMMKWMTPIMMLLFFYNAPAGLTLYVMASTASSVVEQMIIRRHIQQQEALAAATETVVEAPGKVARASRPKKPKGPGWFKHG